MAPRRPPADPISTAGSTGRCAVRLPSSRIWPVMPESAHSYPQFRASGEALVEPNIDPFSTGEFDTGSVFTRQPGFTELFSSCARGIASPTGTAVHRSSTPTDQNVRTTACASSSHEFVVTWSPSVAQANNFRVMLRPEEPWDSPQPRPQRGRPSPRRQAKPPTHRRIRTVRNRTLIVAAVPHSEAIQPLPLDRIRTGMDVQSLALANASAALAHLRVSAPLQI